MDKQALKFFSRLARVMVLSPNNFSTSVGSGLSLSYDVSERILYGQNYQNGQWHDLRPEADVLPEDSMFPWLDAVECFPPTHNPQLVHKILYVVLADGTQWFTYEPLSLRVDVLHPVEREARKEFYRSELAILSAFLRQNHVSGSRKLARRIIRSSCVSFARIGAEWGILFWQRNARAAEIVRKARTLNKKREIYALLRRAWAPPLDDLSLGEVRYVLQAAEITIDIVYDQLRT